MPSLTEQTKAVSEAANRLGVLPTNLSDANQYAVDVAKVIVFLDTTLPNFLRDIKKVTDDV